MAGRRLACRSTCAGMTRPYCSSFEFIKHDIVQPLDVDPKSIDQIYNLACPASPPHYQRDPVKTMQTAFNGLLNLLELARCVCVDCCSAPLSFPRIPQ